MQKIKMAVDYIEENYAKDLNMAVVSNYISMNYSPVFLLIQAVYLKQFCELSQGNPHERGKKTPDRNRYEDYRDQSGSRV